MNAVSNIVYLVLLWSSLSSPTVVSGQCTTTGCGAFDTDDANADRLLLQIADQKIQQLQLAMAQELGML